MFREIFISFLGKQSVIISYKTAMKELLHDSLNHLDLRN